MARAARQIIQLSVVELECSKEEIAVLRSKTAICSERVIAVLLSQNCNLSSEYSSSSTERRIICRAARAIESFSRFEARSQDPISWVLRSNGKIGTGGPEWARTTDLTIISRTL